MYFDLLVVYVQQIKPTKIDGDKQEGLAIGH